MVIPRSRSRSFESMMRSATTSFSRKTPACLSMASTSVVLPWSTCATMAMLRRRFCDIGARRGSTPPRERRTAPYLQKPSMQTLPAAQVLAGVAVGSHSLPRFDDDPQTSCAPELVVTDLQTLNLSAVAHVI